MAQGDRCSWHDDDARAFTELMLRHTRQHGVVFFDTGGTITGWNQGACFITGFTDQEVIGQSAAILFLPEDRSRGLDEHERNAARAVGAAEDERWHLRKDGSRFWSTGLCVPIRRHGDEITGFVKVFRDATHLRTRMKYLENLLQECNVRQRDRDVFLGTIAHEMRNPLAPLKTAIHLLKTLPEASGRGAHPLRIMERQLGFLERLVEDLVDLTRVQAGKMTLACRPVRLQDALTDAMESCREAADRRGVALHPVFPTVPIKVLVDPERLNQVIVNLMNNAIKFTERGGSVWLTCTADQTHFIIYLKDNGKGISRELLPRIFEVFTQAVDADSQRGAGLGIGLAVVKEIVALHGGTVEVRSEGPEKGSEFIVRIPLAGARESGAAGADSPADG